MYKHIKVTPNKNNVGAIIEAELSKFNDEIIEEIKDALAEYGVVFFRNQNLDSETYIKFAKQFGPLAEYPMLKGLEGHPEITVVEKKPDEQIMFGEGWHTDSTYTKEPPRFTMLYSIKTPEKGKGNTICLSTLFSSSTLLVFL